MPQLFFRFKVRQQHSLQAMASKARLQSSKHTGAKQNLTQKWPFYVIQGHVFWSQWKGEKGPSNTKY